MQLSLHITHLITDPCYAGATHNCAAPVITTSFYRNIYPQPDEAVATKKGAMHVLSNLSEAFKNIKYLALFISIVFII